MAEQNLTNKTVKGAAWAAIEQVARLGIQFIVGIILARLLSPYEYGLIGVLMVFITIFNAIVDSGFSAALIRKQNTRDEDYSTVFFVNLGVSIVMAFLMYISANAIAIFFEREELVTLTQAMSIVIVINALAIVQRTKATKEINFKVQTVISFSASILSGIIGILMAYLGYGVWALVGQQISLALFTTVLFWILCKWKPLLVFSLTSFKEMWSFGWKLLIVTFIDNAWKEVYQIVVGKCYSPVTLGLYTRAKQFSQVISHNINGVVQRVTYPVLSEIQDDIPRLKEAYRRIIKTTMLPTFVLMYGMAGCAKPMIYVLLGEKWMECVPFLQIICIYGALYPLHAINLNMLQVQGRSDLILRLEIIKKSIMVGPILLGIFYSIYAMVSASILTSFINFCLNSHYSGPYLGYSTKDQIKDIFPSFGIAVLMELILLGISLIPISCYILLPLQIIVAAVVVLTICEKLKLSEYIEIKGILLSKIRR